MKQVLALIMILNFSSAFAGDLNMNKTMKEMKVSLKCLTKTAGLTDSCKSDLEEVAKMKQNLTMSAQASKNYYLKLYNEKLIPQVPNDGDIQKAFTEVLELVAKLEQAINTKDNALREQVLQKITASIKQSHNQYKPELE